MIEPATFSIQKAQFLREIIEDANAGRTFVPFIGSGLSSPSGIIMGMEFTHYLAFTTYLVLCDPASRAPTHGEGQAKRWSLEVQGWPPLPSRKEVVRAEKWIKEQFKEAYSHSELDLLPNYDEQGYIQSLVQNKKSPIDDFALAMTQPPIPMILRSWRASENESRLRHLRRILSPERENKINFLSTAWQRSNQSYHDIVIESGIRALADWRETLEFLCRVRIENGGAQSLRLGEPNPAIIDDFNSTITRDKKPSLGHKIIAHLSEPLRMFTLLTTNFDTLTEDAYRALSLPLTVLPVSSRGDLPDPRTAGSCDALIKLHGESHDTRADLSLDEEPSEEDKETFLAYMERGTGHLLSKSTNRAIQQYTCRLLVVGYSGNDHRCIQMIKHWLEHSVDEAKVYWICFSQDDQKKVDRLFSSRSYDDRIRTVLTPRPDLLLYELYQRLQLSLPPGGLTYQFSHELPPYRVRTYDHAISQVRAVVSESTRSDDIGALTAKYSRRMLRDATVLACKEHTIEAVTKPDSKIKKSSLVSVEQWTPSYRFEEDSVEATKQINQAHNKLNSQPAIIHCSGGVVRANAIAASELTAEHHKKVLWIECQDYPDVDSLLRDFLRSLALSSGQYQAKHVTMHPISEGLSSSDIDNTKSESKNRKSVEKTLDRLERHIRGVLEDYRYDPDSVAVLLNGRDSYGCASGLVTSPWLNEDNSEYRRLHVLIEALARVGISVVYFPCSKARSLRKQRLINQCVVDEKSPIDFKERNETPFVSWPSDIVADTYFYKEGSQTIAETIAGDVSVFADIVRDTLSDFYEISENADSLTFEPKTSLAEHDYKRMEFLYALTLFRHSRHPNAIGAEGAFSCPHRYQSFAVDNDFVRAVQVNSWIQDLCNKRVFFSKPGGSLWMHRDVREAVHRVLESTNISRFRGGKENRGYSSFRQARGRKHFWIGEWYYKAFCSSGHLTPVIECVYHLISSAIYSQYAFPKQRRKEKIEEASLLSHRCMMFESAMVQASKMLLLSWRSIELWQSSSADVAWLNEPHRIQIKRELEQAATSLIGDKRTNKRIEKCMLDFLTIHSALHDAVILEGGRSKRGATSWSSPESMIMRLAETDEKPVPETLGSRKELQHGIDKIRLPEKATATSNKTESEEPQDFWSMLRSEIDPGTHKLWDTIIEISRNRPENYERFGREKAAWKADAENRHFQDFIWFLGEAAYVLLRRAKLKLHATNEIDESTWIASTICCNLGIDLCKHLPASNLAYEVRSKIKMHSIYSVGLANLGRFFEANRHLNEAQGLLSKWQGATEEDHAVISIRRAEVKVTECRWIAMFLSPELELNDGNCI